MPSSRTDEEKETFAIDFIAKQKAYAKKKKEEKEAAEALANAEAWQRVQMKSREETKRAAIAGKRQ